MGDGEEGQVCGAPRPARTQPGPRRASATSYGMPAPWGVGPLAHQKGEVEASLPFSLPFRPPSGPGRWVQKMPAKEAEGRSKALCSWTWVNIYN